MHFGRNFWVIGQYREERAGSLGETVLMEIRQAGQEWESTCEVGMTFISGRLAEPQGSPRGIYGKE